MFSNSPQNGLYIGGGGFPRSPGSKSGLELNAPVTSRKWRPSPKPASDAPVSVVDCIYRFDGEGAFTGTGGTWGDARYIELYMLADDDEYSKAKTGICFINLVEYDFVVTTRAELPSDNTYWQRVDDSNILRTDGTPIEVFG